MTVKQTRSTCPYCGVGCGVVIESSGDQIVGVRGDPDHPANFGKLCSKGSSLHLTARSEIQMQTRLLQPMRRLHKHAKPIPQTWDQSLEFCTEAFAQVITEHGPDAVGFYISGQLLTEDYYVFNKLAKGLIGTNNVDTNSRLCMSSAVAGYKLTLGADAPPCSYSDIDAAQCIVIAGSNAAWAHPVLYRRIEAAKAANPHMQVVVIDPRRTDTALAADLHLALQPGTDVLLFHGLLHTMMWEGWIDLAYVDAHTTGFSDLKALVREATPERVAQVCGLRKEDVFAAAQAFATSKATLSLYCQGLNQSSSGTAKNAALINLHLATGQIGKPGAGPFSLTGQPNAMGGREVGGLANLLSAHRDMGNAEHRAEVARLWGVPDVPSKPGKTAIEMFQAAADGEIKALWIACTNPAQSMPDQNLVRRALERAEIVVVQEAYATTATARFADVLLPATTWGEKDGTVTNSERRVSRVRTAVAPPQLSDQHPRHDWQIAAEFGKRLATRLGKPTDLLDFATPESVWLEHRESTRGRDLDITGMSYAMLEAAPQQWPLPQGQFVGLERLYADGVFPTADGKAKFSAIAYKPLAEARESRYPFSLNTGRLRDQWHGMSRTGVLGRLFGHAPEPEVELSAQDMSRKGWVDGDLVHVTSKRGSIVLPARASDAVGLNQAFVGMHWGEEFVSGRSNTGERLGGINAITTSAYCPTSKQPELKHAAVKILKAELPWRLTAMAWLPDSQAWRIQGELRQLMGECAFASMSPFVNPVALEDAANSECQGVIFRAAADDPPSDAWLDQLEALLNLQGRNILRYADAKRSQRRSIRVDASKRIQALLLAGDVSAQAWLGSLVREQLDATPYSRALLSPSAKAPLNLPVRGAAVCTCFGVDAKAISDVVRRCGPDLSDRLAVVQSQLKCGTGCGSCLPELKRLLAA